LDTLVKKLKKKQAIKQLQEVKLEEEYEEYIDKY
jgi:mannitol/fructose-specific phosphotransferase system IIA component (Ntr-type)